ncbi:Hypp1824 [Branchiostoma lanceolatum]|uniref:Hypp1824 protein n=1 Tax=Branchiostoma lanceolatum TaxID=7740 RepID=A0A8K0EPZ5_BRALA|nr:Hypp1824 [Branchiostoma lanceolatum]
MDNNILTTVLRKGAFALLGTGSIDPLIGPDCYTVCTQSIPGTCYNPCIGTWTTGSDLLPDLLHPITKDGNTVECGIICAFPGICWDSCDHLLPTNDPFHADGSRSNSQFRRKTVSAEKMAAAARALFPNVNPDLGCAGQVVCTMSIPGTCYDPCTGQTWTTGQSLMEDLIGQLKPVAP